ncbi:MAG TPA: 16S rRNA (guanine(527)-N(7))-methyltransferase RsmG [Aquifex sp.]|uniref:Ribosomal RNA small subunit methyltransferase G n=1 Tax=Aquifex aeolicus TaxID=63363 RepID=A0A9D1CEY0_AQUAO|nr:16S rRNA (guanine(527)-N(7))-methyltransferase RsmG [Aquifex sp.]HIP98049.1 16S rRNA (guanine(527)-N(7))-methyltransferase RsmG [Aquifex aeolicus]
MTQSEEFNQILKNCCERNGIALDEKQLYLFGLYLKELQKWNKVHNLISTENEREIACRHFCDSLTLVKFFEELGYKPHSLVDVGSGAGFPGVPLKIYYGDTLEVCLIESNTKKSSFLTYLKTKLGINYRVYPTLAQKVEIKCDVAVARALEVKGKKKHPLEYAVSLLSGLAKSLIAIMGGKNIDPLLVKKLNLKVFELNTPNFRGLKILYKFLED